MGYRFPGPQGIGPSVSDKIDSGTLIRTASRVPSVVSGDAPVKQNRSWTRQIRDLPQSAEEMTAKLGEIYFQTDEDVLDANDEQELTTLCDNLRSLLKEGYRFDLKCTGYADHRASESYNLALGDRRAEAVKRYITAMVPDCGLRVLTKSEGEKKATQPGRDKKRVSPLLMAFDRRVDIAFETVVLPVRIGITGNWMHTRSLEMLELNNNGRIFTSTAERVTVMIKTNYQVVGVAGRREAKVECTVTRVDTGTLLFTASAVLDADRVIMRKGYKTSPNSRVTRYVLPGSEPPPGAKIVDVPDRATTDQASDLLPIIYEKLKGQHPNITERVKEALKLAEAVK